VIKECQITGRSGHAFSFADDGSDATRVSYDPHYRRASAEPASSHRAHTRLGPASNVDLGVGRPVHRAFRCSARVRHAPENRRDIGAPHLGPGWPPNPVKQPVRDVLGGADRPFEYLDLRSTRRCRDRCTPGRSGTWVAVADRHVLVMVGQRPRRAIRSLPRRVASDCSGPGVAFAHKCGGGRFASWPLRSRRRD
jgi:hypothetical protein